MVTRPGVSTAVNYYQLDKTTEKCVRQRRRATSFEGVRMKIARYCLGIAALMFSGISFAADGYTYALVHDFPLGGESVCDFAINDNGDVAYLTQLPDPSG